jgi:hypoxanthine-guanine phosphoribosyltransferase
LFIDIAKTGNTMTKVMDVTKERLPTELHVKILVA